MDRGKFGIYINPKELKAARVNSPYWIPSEPDWVLLTPDVNMTLLKVRELAVEKKIVSDPDRVVWG